MNKLEAVKAMLKGQKVANNFLHNDQRYIFFDASFIDNPFNVAYGDTGVMRMDEGLWAADEWSIYQDPKKLKKVYLWDLQEMGGSIFRTNYFYENEDDAITDSDYAATSCRRVDESEWEVEDV